MTNQNTKKHILLVNGNLKMGGVQKTFVEYLKSIDTNKYKISVLILENFDDDNENEYIEEIPKNIKIDFLKKEKLKQTKKKSIKEKLLFEVDRYKKRKLIKKEFLKYLKTISKIDVIVDFNYELTKIIKYVKNVKKIMWVHTSLKNYLKKDSRIKRYGKKFNNYDSIVLICKSMRDEFIGMYPKLKDKIKIIYNLIDRDDIIEKSKKTDDLSEKEKELLKQDYLVSVSRLDNRSKDFSTLLRAFKLLVEKDFNTKLYIVGDGPYKSEIEKIIDSLDLNDIVHLIGKKDNPYVWMRHSRFLVHSSKFEGFCNVLVEAMMLDKVVICSNAPVGPSEILQNGESGMLFEVGNEKEFADKMKLLLNNKNKFLSLEHKSKERSKEFNKKIELEKFYNIIDNL